MSDDDMSLKDIQRWYAKHGMRYEEEDWGPRSETGESDGKQVQEGERTKEVRSTDSTPSRMWWWERQVFPWKHRTLEDRDWVLALDEFFAPYLAMLPRPKGNLVQQIYGDLSTYQAVADETGVSRQAAHKATRKAVEQLTKLIAMDDHVYACSQCGLPHAPESATEAAQRVFERFLRTRKGEA